MYDLRYHVWLPTLFVAPRSSCALYDLPYHVWLPTLSVAPRRVTSCVIWSTKRVGNKKGGQESSAGPWSTKRVGSVALGSHLSTLLVWPPLQGGTNSCVYRTAFLSQNVPEPSTVSCCRAAGRLPSQSLINRDRDPCLRLRAARHLRCVAGRRSRSCLGLPRARLGSEVKSVPMTGW